MTTVEETINKLLLLPEDVQRQALDYIDFLYSKYAIPVDELEEAIEDAYEIELEQAELDALEEIEEEWDEELPDENEELSQEVKNLLDERLAANERNPEDVVTWDEVKEKFNQKYTYEIEPEQAELDTLEGIEEQLDETLPDENEELPQELKNLLDERLAAHEENPSSAKSWEEIEERLLKKYNHEI